MQHLGRLAASFWMLLSSLYGYLHAEERPNVLWITSEDNSADYLGCYGNQAASTPHLDRFAEQGFLYRHCYSNGAVCSTSRSTWVMGMMAVTAGSHHHRSLVSVPDSIELYPRLLKEAGYYTANFKKCDYNLPFGHEIWEGGQSLDWQTLQKRQPFFQVVNLGESHESRAMNLTDPQSQSNIPLPPYYPETEIVRQNLAVYYDAMSRMDAKFGATLAALKQAGLADNTIVVYCSDHGGALPRGKRFLFNSGTHCPLIVYLPEKYRSWYPAEQPGSRVDRLVSFVDMPKTWLSLTGASVPSHYQGSVFLGDHIEPEPRYHFSFRGRNGERIENVRSIREKRFLLIKNFEPHVPRAQRQEYQWGIPLQQEWEKCYHDGTLNPTQSRYFQRRSVYELYDTESDPHCIHNLAEDADYADQLNELKQALREHQIRYRDAGLIPESMLLRLASHHQLTPFEVLQSEKLYSVALLEQASHLALDGKQADRSQFLEWLDNPHAGVRYWAIRGLDALYGVTTPENQDLLLKCLGDPEPSVSTMAAISLYKTTQNPAAKKHIETRIRMAQSAPGDRIPLLDELLHELLLIPDELLRPFYSTIAARDDLEGITYQLQQHVLVGEGKKK